MKIIRKSYLIGAPVAKVYQALVDPKIIDRWGAGPAQMSDRVGATFSLWGGDIHGTNRKIVKNKTIVQDWFGGDWEKPSKLTIELTGEKGKTRVDLTHQDVPEKEIKSFASGWDEYYFGAIKELLER
ncbi:SRPBCC domain-containing protein [Candidatus Berkelbacteria bacterium]|nr:SRPBCC domain-containing protein [Candidatus Berkelbacteria bacterium]